MKRLVLPVTAAVPFPNSSLCPLRISQCAGILFARVKGLPRNRATLLSHRKLK